MKIKSVCKTIAGLVLAAGTLSVANAWDTSGYVVCDANQNGQIDANDSALSGVLVVVTNVAGTYSNANWTAASDGGFVIDLPNQADTYVEYLHPLTLPSDARVVLPSGGVYQFTLDSVTQSNFLGSFLISSSLCASNTPPPPPTVNSNLFCLKAEATICGGRGKPLYVVAGEVSPVNGGTNACGEWAVVASASKLKFLGRPVDIVDEGQDTDANGSVYKYMEFEGTGTLKGFGGCRANYGVVSFYARVEDHGKCRTTPDSIYFRAYLADGTTRLLISADSNNPLNVAPVNISKGNVELSVCCQSGHNGEGEGEGDHGKGGQNSGRGKGQGNDNGNHGDNNNNNNCPPSGQGNGHQGGNSQGDNHGKDSGKGHGNSGNGNSNGKGGHH